MALTLREDMYLEPRPAEGYVALFPGDRGEVREPVFRLHPFQGLALALFDGSRQNREVAEILSSATERTVEDAGGFVDATLRRYRQFLIEVPAAGGTADGTPDRDPADFLFSTSYDFRPMREAAPSALLWVVTEYCDKKCRYCFMNAIFTEDRPPDLELGYGRMCELLEEAAEIGVNRVILSGGEPFLRPDLIDLIGVMVEKRLDVVPITKSRIAGERMEALAATGLSELHVSLDSHVPATVDELTGVPGAFDQMIETVEGAAAHGIDVVLRPVLTDLNVRDVEGIVQLAVERGVRRILLDVYGQGCGRHQDSLHLTPQSREWLDANWPRIEEEYRDAPTAISFDLPAKPTGSHSGCVEGLRGMTVLPDGKVTKCDHWRSDDRLVYGDLRHQPILEAWNSDALMQINFPQRQAYAGSICFHCKNLYTCDHVRGRCSMSSLVEYGTHTAPDTYCPIGAFERRLPSQQRPDRHSGSRVKQWRSDPSSTLVQLGGGRLRKAGATA